LIRIKKKISGKNNLTCLQKISGKNNLTCLLSYIYFLKEQKYDPQIFTHGFLTDDWQCHMTTMTKNLSKNSLCQILWFKNKIIFKENNSILVDRNTIRETCTDIHD
jgi:hypothetical protein